MSEYLLMSLETMSAAADLIEESERLSQISEDLRAASQTRLLDLDDFLAGFRADSQSGASKQ